MAIAAPSTTRKRKTPAKAVSAPKQRTQTLKVASLASYDGARFDRTVSAADNFATNPDSPWANRERIRLMFQAEDLCKNSDWVNYLYSRRQYCSSQLSYSPQTGDASLDKEVSDYLKNAWRKGGINCSMQEAFSRTADVELPMRGDSALIWYRDISQLRLVEVCADQIGELYGFTHPFTYSAEDYQDPAMPGMDYVSGVYCAPNGGNMAFKIYERGRSITYQSYVNPRIYPASQVIYFQDNIFRGIRGITKFAQAMLNIQKRNKTWQHGLDSMALQSKIAAVVSNEQGEPDELTYNTQENSDGSIQYTETMADGAIMKYQFKGDSYQFMKSEQPGESLLQGLEYADERTCLSLGFPKAFLISARDGGGAPSRFDMERAGKEITRIREEVHRPRLDVIAYGFIMDAVNRGVFKPHPKILRGTWNFPPLPSADAFRDDKSDIMAIRAGLDTATGVLAARGLTFQTVLDTRGEESFAIAKKAQDINSRLVIDGYKPTVSVADIAQSTDNPQQLAQAEQIETGAPKAPPVQSQNGSPVAEPSAPATMAEWDESKHPRGQPGNAGEFGPGGGSAKAPDKKSKNVEAHPAFDFKKDMQAQAQWLDERAKEKGHADVNELAEKNPKHFSKLSDQWRKDHPRTSPPPLSVKAQRAKDNHHMVDAGIQRYAEEYNEPRMAKALGGVSFPDSEPIDIAIAGDNGVVKHGIELKTIVSNKAGKITMKGDAIARKRSWERKNKATIHTVVIDDSEVFNANGEGKHDESKRKIYYRRGYGSFRIASMHKVANTDELRKILDTPTRQLPSAAK